MFESIKKVKEQLLWNPEISGPAIRLDFKKIIVCGMGGSNIAGGFLGILRPDLEIVSHRTYGLPAQAGLPENASKDDLIIISSYSGNTEEALDSFEKAIAGGFKTIAISTGGELLKRALETGAAFIKIPDTGIEPRMALGFSFLAVLKAIGDEKNLENAGEFGKIFDPEKFEEEGRGIAEKLENKVPIIYSSWNNKAIAYAWKIKLNETAKTPSFFNVFPEINHNEMVGFEKSGSMKSLSDNFYFVFIKSGQDHAKIQKRMEITKNIFEEKNYPCYSHELSGLNRIAEIFNSLAVADWTSYYLAKYYGVDPENISLVEEFKKKMRD